MTSKHALTKLVKSVSAACSRVLAGPIFNRVMYPVPVIKGLRQTVHE